ncbi:MAG TPA: DNA polymerase III subunit alpha [Blastocatellia bacterium]|nr:DNA polymerase III subunit alpha [Blastocatellia bacterium]
MNEKDFVHLHLHSDFSLLDGAIQIKPLAQRAQELGARAVAVTDHGNMYGAISFYNQMKSTGIKPIIGMEAYIARGKHTDRGEATGEKGTNHIILLAKNLQGYRNLVKLSSLAFTKGYYYKPRIDKELLAEHGEGLVALSACLSGVPSSLLLTDKFEEAARRAKEFEDILGKGNYYLEVQNHGLDEEVKTVIPGMLELSKKTGIPLAATNDCHYLMRDDWRAHDILVCIGAGKTVNEKRGLKYKEGEFYFRSAKEMWLLFGKDMPEALLNTVAIAEMCELELPKGENHLPVYRVPEGETIDSYFAKMAREGLEERWAAIKDRPDRKHDLDEYKARLEKEIEVITKMGFPGYFLIVWDFIAYAKRNNIPVGPGRGSAAGSLVAYSLKITDVDPLQYDLLFERFLNPERVSMPDIDIDFCVRGRQQVIDYVADYYGRDHVSQISTFGTMASKAAIKDVGRALEMPYSEVDKIAKMIPPPVRGRNVSIEDAIKQNPDLKKAFDTDPRVKEVIEIAKRLEGCSRHASVHAAGVVISPKPLYELVPVSKTARDEITTQYPMTDLEKTGMLKMDFLALTTLTIIDDCLKSIERETGVKLDLTKIPLDDKAALQLFCEGKTEAIFQFESEGMKDICRRLKPEGLEDLSALNALYRPGPIDSGMIDDFIDRRHGRKKVSYSFPELKEVMGNTLGVLVYQEQIMAVFQKLAGYSLGEADLVRRAMGKKKREELDKHKEKFIRQAMERGHDKNKLEKLWASIEGFADYAFNRAHSFSYGYLAYQTAYLKAHYPTHFWAAVLSNELNNTAKVVKYINEARSQGIEILPPDVNASLDNFTANGNSIRFGLAAIKGIGQSAVSSIIEARNREGAFRSIFDFTERVDSKAVNKRVLESLIKSGAFDSINRNRAQMFAAIDSAIESGQRVQKSRATGQTDLFGSLGAAVPVPDPPMPNVAEWSQQELLKGEKETLGFYISGHPLLRYEQALNDFANADVDRLSGFHHGAQVTIGGIVVDLNVRTTKKGDRFGLFHIEDQFGTVKVVAWPDVFGKANGVMQNDSPVLVKGRLEIDDGGAMTIIADEIQSLENIRERATRTVLLRFKADAITTERLDKLHDLLDSHRGDSTIIFEVELEDGQIARIQPNQFVRVKVTPELTNSIKEVMGDCRVELIVQRAQSAAR